MGKRIDCIKMHSEYAKTNAYDKEIAKNACGKCSSFGRHFNMGNPEKCRLCDAYKPQERDPMTL